MDRRWLARVALNGGLLLTVTLSMLLGGCGTATMNTATVLDYQLSGQTKHADFRLDQMRMTFSSGLPDRTLKRGETVKPEAVIKFRGVGILRGNWLLDETIIEQVSINLNRGAVLRLSPKKPVLTQSLDLGVHTLRLQILSPNSTFQQPELSFFITP